MRGDSGPYEFFLIDVTLITIVVGTRSTGGWPWPSGTGSIVTPTVIEHVPTEPVRDEVDPTGAGDTYSATYLVQRAAGAEPVEAARVAAATVSEFLATP